MTSTNALPAPLAKLVKRREVADRTVAFEFEKPPGWTFKAGQAVDVTLLEPPESDGAGNTRTLSIASAPGDGTIMVVTRMRDTAFKRVLSAMPSGAKVKFEGPFGNLILHNNVARAAVILAGGIGITPFRSMVFHAAQEKLPHRIYLFYSNRRPEDAAFLEELETLEKQNQNYRFIPTMTSMEKSHRAWNGETGRINQRMLSRHSNDAPSPIYYIAGPPGMVKGLHAMLHESGVDDDDIRTEEFGGY